MTEQPTARRPVVVTIAVVLTYISGLSSIGLGLLVLLSRYDVTDSAAVWADSLVGAGIILLGLLIIGVASGISRGSRLSRIVLTVYVSLQLLLHVLAIIAADFDWIAGVQMTIGVFILLALWLPATSRFFRESPQIRAA
ncbi:hypothetical protein GCM10009808_16280 [Microbacterium sediminicola]|uniref:Uncharacterized protein n=1 Tax=Microbacterium sediminicola TaxID=415210 RepID=A0ABN2I6X9_9MICO